MASRGIEPRLIAYEAIEETTPSHSQRCLKDYYIIVKNPKILWAKLIF